MFVRHDQHGIPDDDVMWIIQGRFMCASQDISNGCRHDHRTVLDIFICNLHLDRMDTYILEAKRGHIFPFISLEFKLNGVTRWLLQGGRQNFKDACIGY